MAKKKVVRKKVSAKSSAKPHVAPKPARKPRRPPRQPALGGMEDARIQELDDICAALASTREEINELRTQEDRQSGEAVEFLHKHRKGIWKANGFEIALVPGGEKLRKRIVKEKSERSQAHGQNDDVAAADSPLLEWPRLEEDDDDLPESV